MAGSNRSKDPKAKLTPGELKFVLHYFENQSPVDAYKFAFDKDPDSDAQWIAVEASQLLSVPKVALKLKALQDQAAASVVYNVHTALKELDEAQEIAKTEGQSAGFVAAVRAKMSLLGLDKPKKVDLSGTIKIDPLEQLIGEIHGGEGDG